MPPSQQILKSALLKSKTPRTKNTLNVRVYGVYSLPKIWKDKITDPNEENYHYQVKFAGISIDGAKMHARELTAEEKAEAEAAKGKKGKGKGDEEPLPEEIALKEMIANKREGFEEMSERERFFKIHEDHTIDTSLRFTNPKQSLLLVKDKLWEFEELVNDDNGVFLEFSKTQVAEDETDPKKKAKAKPTEPLPQFFAKGWVDFTPLMVPGKKHTLQRILLKATNPPPKSDGEGDAENNDDEEKEPDPIFEEAQTYIYVHVSTQFAINPSIKPGEEEEPEEPEGEGEEETKNAAQPPPEPPKDSGEDSFIEEDEFIEDEKPKVKLNPEVYDELDTNYGDFSKTQDATANFRIIIQKYLKKISDHYTIVMAPDESELKANSKMAAIPSHSSAFQRQKRIEKYIFQSDKMYSQLKKELKMAIHRIIRDKYHKSVG